MPTEWVVLADLKKARGLRGELFAESWGSPPERFTPCLPVMLFAPEGNGAPEREVRVERHWVHSGRLVLKFQEIRNRTEAEAIEHWQVRIPLEQRPALPDGQVYLSDLIGCRLVSVDGEDLGVVDAWQEAGPQVLLQSGELLIPYVPEICVEVLPAGKRVTVRLPEGLRELNEP